MRHLVNWLCSGLFLLFFGRIAWAMAAEAWRRKREERLRAEDPFRPDRVRRALRLVESFARETADRESLLASWADAEAIGVYMLYREPVRQQYASIIHDAFDAYPPTPLEAGRFSQAFASTFDKRTRALREGDHWVSPEGPQLPQHLSVRAFFIHEAWEELARKDAPVCGWEADRAGLTPDASYPPGYDRSSHYAWTVLEKVTCEACLSLLEAARELQAVQVGDWNLDEGTHFVLAREAASRSDETLLRLASLSPVLAREVGEAYGLPRVPEEVPAAPEPPPKRAPAPAPSGLTAQEWDGVEAEALLQHVVPLIRREHLGLVLAGLCESVLPIWQKTDLDDERLCWCIASLRAWCCGEASSEELRRATLDEDDLDEEGRPRNALVDDWGVPFAELSTRRFADDGAAAVGAAVAHAMRAVLFMDPMGGALSALEAVIYARAADEEAVAEREYEAWMEALSAEADAEAAMDDRRPDEDFSAEQLAAQEERWEAADAAEAKLSGAWSRGVEQGAEEAKEFIRLCVPFRTTRAQDWRFEKGFIRSGGAVLRLDGWRLIDAVAQEELVKLTGSRAVEWDVAQERTGWILYQR